MEKYEPGYTNISTETTLNKLTDLFPLYFRAGENEYFSVLQADSKVFQEWVSQYIVVELEEGASELWSPLERFDVLKMCMDLGVMHNGAIYVKGAVNNVGKD